MRYIVIGLILFVALIIGGTVWYNHQYPCIRGHYQNTFHMVPGKVPMSYYSNDFYCDCRVHKDSLKNKTK